MSWNTSSIAVITIMAALAVPAAAETAAADDRGGMTLASLSRNSSLDNLPSGHNPLPWRDTMLESMISQAMGRNPTVDAKRSEVLAARHEVKAARWQYAPSVSAQYQKGSGSNKDLYGSSIRADQRLYAGGRLDADLDSAVSREDSARIAVSETRLDLALQVTSAYQSLQASQGQLAAIASYQERLAGLNGTIGRRIDSGVSSPSEQSLMNARVAQSQTDTAAAQAAHVSARALLQRLTGGAQRGAWASSTNLQAQPLPAATAEHLRLPEVCATDAQGEAAVQAAVDAHPAVRRALQDVQTARFTAEGLRAALYPGVLLRLEQPVGHVPAGTEREARVSVLLSYTPDAGLSTGARARAGEARVTSLQAQAESLRQEIGQQIRTECADLSGLAERVSGHVQARGYTQEVLSSYTRLFLAGKRGWLDVLNAAREDFDNEQSAVTALAAFQASSYRLRLVSGALPVTDDHAEGTAPPADALPPGAGRLPDTGDAALRPSISLSRPPLRSPAPAPSSPSSSFDTTPPMTPAAEPHDGLWLTRRLPELIAGLRRPTRVDTASLRRASVGSRDLVQQVCGILHLEPPTWSHRADASTLPMLALVPDLGICICYAEGGPGHWLAETAQGARRIAKDLPGVEHSPLRPLPAATRQSPAGRGARGLFKQALRAQRPSFLAASMASLLANVVALAASLYSMQVYDRVIPTQGLSTLTVLTVGALMACVFELVIKLARSSLLDTAVRRMDTSLSHGIFQRLIGVRLDQLPSSIGALAAQVRSYESIRAFMTAATMYAAVDAPFALLFLAVMWMIAGPMLVAVPAMCFVVALAVGAMYRMRIAAHARTASNAGNRKAGLLVETIQNAENLKAGGTGWAQSAKWNALSRQSIDDELAIKHCSEQSAYFAAFVQQVSYIAMIAVGAYMASTSTSLTTGGLIACSILSGRVLAPIGMLPGLIVQWAHARTALDNLEGIFALEQDSHGIERPLAPTSVQGSIKLEQVRFAYPGRPPAVDVPQLLVRPGEKVALLGPVGAGKSTLLKIMAGLYKPQQGRVLLDGLELQQIARDQLSEHVGYLSQDVRLVAGTLRENLTTGLPDVDEARLIAACEASGLMALVASHPKGLELDIGEGGSGVSGGQRRAIGLTRLVLSRPGVWLLDEPTASMDEVTERAALRLLHQSMAPQQTLVLVTHKPQLLSLVQRIVVITAEGIALDGPRDAVLRALADGGRTQTQAAPVARDAEKEAA